MARLATIGGLPWWAWAAFGGVALALRSRTQPRGRAKAKPAATPTSAPTKASSVDAAWAQLGMPPAWGQWGRFVALGESGWKIGAQNNTPGERTASTKAYVRLFEHGRIPCPPPPTGPDGIVPTGYGSGGWYGQLAPLTTVFLAEKYPGQLQEIRCDPASVWRSPLASTKAHIAQVRGTLRAATNKLGRPPTFLQLRALYGLPSRDPLAVDTPQRRTSYDKKRARAGLPAGWLDQRAPPLPYPSGTATLESSAAVDDGLGEIELAAISEQMTAYQT